MNTFLLREDNTIVRTEESIVVEKSNNVESVQFICEKTYNNLDMSTFDLVLEYTSPISKDNKWVTLELEDELYKDEYLVYKLPLTAIGMTSECGRVEMNLSFMKIEYDSEGQATKYVRNFTPTFLTIVPLSTFFSITDTGLSQLAELYLNNKAQILALQEIANGLAATIIPDDLAISENGHLQLSAQGEVLGEGVSVAVSAIEEGELDGVHDGILDIDTIII